MITYYLTDRDRIGELRRRGLPEDDGPYPVIASLDRARAEAGERALVALDLLRTSPEREGETDDRTVSGAEPDALLNVDPYRPPERIRAAGGYVLRSREGRTELLLMRRRGTWDLPKGTVESGEALRTTARREVSEETGLTDLTVLADLGRTVHGYYRDDRFWVKTTAWYAMRAGGGTLRPQQEEQIEQLEWVPLAEARRRVGYRTLAEHLERWTQAAREALGST